MATKTKAAKPVTPPAPGQYWAEQKAWYAGIVCRPDGAAWHLLLPKGVKFKTAVLPWGEYGVSVKGADSIYNGQANTAALLAVGSPIASHAKALGDDIYVPSRAEALLLFATLKSEFETGYWYWTSTECSELTAYGQYFTNGTQHNGGKNNERRCRFVRRLIIQSFSTSPVAGLMRFIDVIRNYCYFRSRGYTRRAAWHWASSAL